MKTRRNLLTVTAAALVVVGCGRTPEQNFNLGAAAYQQGKFSRAAEYLEQAVAQAPPTAQALTLLGVCRLKDHKTDAATRAFNDALKLDANYIPALYNLALVNLERGQFQTAADQLKQLQQKPGAPADTGAYLAIACNNLAVTTARQRDYKRAEQYLQIALAADPKSVETARNIAALKTCVNPQPLTATATTTLTATATTTLTVVANTNTPAKPLIALAPTTTTTKATTPATSTQTQTVRTAAATTPPATSAPSPAPAARTPATTASASTPDNNTRRAALAPRTLVPGDRAKATLHFNEAVVLHQQGRLTNVVDLYKLAIAADPTFAPAYFNLANAQRDLRDTGHAFENYELALMAEPKYSDARLNYALLLQKNTYIADALDQYEILLQQSPNNALLHLTVASLYARDRATLAKAREHYETYLRIAPDAPHAAEIRAWLDKNR
jgi:tetratricopeptide (TPR) repeat protein